MPTRLILVGQVTGAFGVRGEVRIAAYTEDPLSLLAYRTILREDGTPALNLESGRAQSGALIARARQVITREEVEALRGLRLYVDRDELPPTPQDEYYLADLIGLAARSVEGEAIGRVKSVANFGAGDLLEIEPADHGPTWWAPFTLAVATEVRLDEGYIVIRRPAETEA